MDKRDYLGFVAILEDARTSICGILNDLSSRDDATASRLKRVVVDLERAIQAYREEADGART
jgi:hypothetical protein